MREPNVRGLVAGRALLYPTAATSSGRGRAAAIVHGGAA